MLLRSCENPLVNLGMSQPQCQQGSSQLQWPSLTCFPLNFNQTSFGTDSINFTVLPVHHTLTPNISMLYVFWNMGHLLVLLNALLRGHVQQLRSKLCCVLRGNFDFLNLKHACMLQFVHRCDSMLSVSWVGSCVVRLTLMESHPSAWQSWCPVAVPPV